MQQRQKLLVSIFSFLMGTVIVLAVFDIGPMGEADAHAPAWLIGLCGVVFLALGTVGLNAGPILPTILGGIVMIGMTVICAWVALFGADEYFSGGANLFSQRTETLIARTIFGAVALMGAAISINAIRKIIKDKTG